MQNIIYWLIGLLWIVACLGLGFYIRSKGMSHNKFRFGITAIFVSYLFGVGILVCALLM